MSNRYRLMRGDGGSYVLVPAPPLDPDDLDMQDLVDAVNFADEKIDAQRARLNDLETALHYQQGWTALATVLAITAALIAGVGVLR